MSDVMEKPVTIKPPSPSAPAVLAHRKRLEAERDALRGDTAELALRSARGDTAARAELRSIPSRLEGLQFEIDQNHAAYEIAHKQDADAEIAWRASLQTLPPEELLAGLTRDECPRACQPGVTNGCVLTGGAPYAGGSCQHPCRFGIHHQFSIDEAGKRIIPHGDHPPAAKIFRAAITRLKVEGKFA